MAAFVVSGPALAQVQLQQAAAGGARCVWMAPRVARTVAVAEALSAASNDPRDVRRTLVQSTRHADP